MRPKEVPLVQESPINLCLGQINREMPACAGMTIQPVLGILQQKLISAWMKTPHSDILFIRQGKRNAPRDASGFGVIRIICVISLFGSGLFRLGNLNVAGEQDV
jgi:hypothetical protein